ncbi:hypothetical protein M2359_003873 [Gordonia amarae]|nr:hypothetical protein [Gordonia amarae]
MALKADQIGSAVGNVVGDIVTGALEAGSSSAGS